MSRASEDCARCPAADCVVRKAEQQGKTCSLCEGLGQNGYIRNKYGEVLSGKPCEQCGGTGEIKGRA